MVVRPPRQQDRVFQILYLHEGGHSPLPAVRGDCKQVIRGTDRGGKNFVEELWFTEIKYL